MEITEDQKNIARIFQQEFFERCPSAVTLLKLFDTLPQTYFYCKDHKSRFVKVNQLFLDNHNHENEWDVIGKCDRDFHPPLMAEAYMSEDQRVMASGKQQDSQIWLVLYRRKTPRWFNSTKTPIFDEKGKVIGLAGVMYLVEKEKEIEAFFKELSPVILYMEKHYQKNISMQEMAELAGLSSTHFNRRFQNLVKITPSKYLNLVRIQAARGLLTTTKKDLASIAMDTGFTDQSHFTRRFREVTGITPQIYRNNYRRKN
jgi:AraC-like DNA-binding protein